MAGAIDITIALDRYDRHFPFFDGTVTAPEGIRYRALQVGQSDRLRDGTELRHVDDTDFARHDDEVVVGDPVARGS